MGFRSWSTAKSSIKIHTGQNKVDCFVHVNGIQLPLKERTSLTLRASHADTNKVQSKRPCQVAASELQSAPSDLPRRTDSVGGLEQTPSCSTTHLKQSQTLYKVRTARYPASILQLTKAMFHCGADHFQGKRVSQHKNKRKHPCPSHAEDCRMGEFRI